MKENIFAGIAILAIIFTCALLFITFSDTKFQLPKLPKLNNSSITEENTKKSTEQNKNNSKNSLVCTKTETDEDGFETKTTLTVSHKNNKVTKVKQEDIQTLDEESVDLVYGFGYLFMTAFSQIDGINATSEKVDNITIKNTIEIDYSKLDFDTLKKTIDDMNSEGGETDQSILSTTKDITIDDFKKEYLNGYACN